MVGKPKLLLVEDHELVRQGIQRLLTPEFEIVAVLEDGEGVLEAVASLSPDLVLLDLALPKKSGVQVLTELVAAVPKIPVVIVTQHVDPVLADLAIGRGARGFVPKTAGIRDLRIAISEVLAGKCYVSPKVTELRRSFPKGTPRDFQGLTPREQDIVRMIGRNKSTWEIGETLGVSSWTIHFHRKNILRKLGLQGERDMIRYAVLVEHVFNPPLIQSQSGEPLE